ncbi:MAG: metallophosphoesterase [Chthoniobacteraceae bacterium]
MPFLILIALMALGDLLWCFRARRLPRRWMRWSIGAFGLLQFLGLAAILSSRGGLPLEALMPRWLHSAILFWHLLVVMPRLLWCAARGAAGLAKRMTRARVAPTPEPAVSGSNLTRREFLGAAAAFTPPLITLGGAGLGESQLEEFRIRRIDVPVPDLPPALDGLTIAHVSDMHVGRFTRGRVLERLVERTNGLNADLITLTGDFINHSLRDLPVALDVVRSLQARHAVAACEGNHDLFENPRIFYRDCESGGLPLLRGEAAGVTIRGQRVQFLGLPWTRDGNAQRAQTRALLARRDPAAWPLLLAHHPHAWDFADEIPLTLCGHTHGGQFMLNERTGCGPMLYRYWSGLYTRPTGSLVVSNGVGNWFPVRIQAPAEIVHLTLRRRASATV